MADISRNQMIFWMPSAGLKAFLKPKYAYVHFCILIRISRRKYERTDITFKSIADLRRELPSQNSLSTLQLIKSFVEKIKNENENANLVRFIFLNVCI